MLLATASPWPSSRGAQRRRISLRLKPRQAPGTRSRPPGIANSKFGFEFSNPPQLLYTRSMPASRPNRITPVLLLLTILISAALLAFFSTRATVHAVGGAAPEIQSFYIVTQATFRDGPAWVDHVLELRRRGAADLCGKFALPRFA